ncbi:MAG: exodeoxyribonuclease VII large subunit [Ruminococcus sp.]|nr:exodeoxyribonuclease VII large subunit [Ruminococcus sp.]
MPILTISQLNRYVAFKLKEDKALSSLLVRGEISNFTCHTRSGHCYFTLKDGEAAVKAVMFRSMAQRLRFRPADGMHVIAAASASLYERDGSFQLYVTDMQQDGVGAQQIAFEQLKQKLKEMGVFDAAAKRPIPPHPKKIGVVTSATGAAVHDVMQVIGRRYPLGTLEIFPAQVQGEAAPASICKAIRQAERAGCDVLIVGRGGGSAEDLSAFNTESVVMAVYQCSVPIISAVGHETDVTLTDAAADLRAPTPSAAAELAVPSAEEMKQLLQQKTRQLQQAFMMNMEQRKNRLQRLSERLYAASPQQKRVLAEQQLKMLEGRLEQAIRLQMQEREAALQKEIARLDTLSPLKILSRGYALVYQEDMLVRSARDVQPDEHLKVRLSKGQLLVKVLERKDDQDDI